MKTDAKIIAIVGPTASGKTGIGVRVAKDFNGEIISADSRQVFCGLDLGSGKEGAPKGMPRAITNNQVTSNQVTSSQVTIRQAHDLPASNKQNANYKLKIKNLRSALRFIDDVPQWLIDIKKPGEGFNLFEFIDLARLAIEDILDREKLPVIVGGTGLYIQGLAEGFQLVESSKSKAKSIYTRAELESLQKEELKQILKDLDGEALDKVDVNNPHRLIRAIERAQDGTEMIKTGSDYQMLQVGLNWPRDVLYERIDKRVDERFDQGMLEEIIGLLKKGVDPEWLMKLGLEYREITQFIISKSLIDLNKSQLEQIKESQEFHEMAQVLKYKIHQFAKRQCTWFNRFPEIVWENDENKIKTIVSDFLKD